MESISLDHLPEGEALRLKVKEEMTKNLLLKDENILVDAEGRDVVLQGDVDSLDKKWLAEDIAFNVFGVLQVKNEIYVVRENDYREDFYEN